MNWNSPEAQALIDQRRQEAQDRYDGKRPLIDPRLGRKTVEDIQPGLEVWARTGVTGLMRLGEGDWEQEGVEAKGGIVLEVTQISYVDTETGEFVNERAYRCFDYTVNLWEAVVVVPESKIDTDRIDPLHLKRVRGLWRKCAAWVGDRAAAPSRTELSVGQVIGQLMAIEAAQR